MLLKNLSIAAVLTLCAAVAPAQVVNLDIEKTAGSTYSGQGAYADSGNDYWNSSLDGMTDLLESDGVTVSTIAVSISADSRHEYSLAHDLMADYSYSRDVDTSITISGLSPNGNYLLYVYCQGDQLSQNATVSFGGSTWSTTGLLDGTMAEGGNYVTVSATANANGEISGTVARNGSSYAAVNGMQIIYTGQSSVISSASNVINVDLGGSSVGTVGDGDNRSGTPFSGQGAYSDDGNDYWNNTLSTDNRTLSDLVTSDGSTVSAVDVTVSGGGGYEDTGKSNYLLSDYFYGESTTVISGLNPEGNYTVYVYACGDQSGQGSDITIADVTQRTSNAGDPDTYSLGVNYVVFETTADIIGRIIIEASDKINGFQLIEGDPAQTGYEAEEAVFSGLSVVAEGNASGHFCLDGFDVAGDYLEYQGVESGDTLMITYASETNTTRCSVYVDDVDVATAYFAATGSDAAFGAVTLSDLDISEGGSVRLQLDADDESFNAGQACAIQDKIDIETDGEVIVVSSIMELLAQLDKSNVNVKMTPGDYYLDSSDKESWLLPLPTFFVFSGDNCTYDFTGVTFLIHTELYDDYNGSEIRIVEVNGNNNHIYGLTQKDVGDEPIGGGGVMNMTVAGNSNLFEEVSIYTRGSSPYGYGDQFGKGGGALLPLDKHAALLVEGIGCHILNCYIDHNAFGHGIFLQGALHTLVEGCYVKGHIRTTDQELAEAGTGSQADGIDFETTWGWKVPAGYAFSCQEDGIRAYNTGSNGRDTAYTTVKNCTVEGMRGGIPIGFSNNDNYIYGCTLLGAEGGFWPGSGNSAVHCQAGAPYARLINNPYDSDNNQTYSLTVLRETEVYGNEQLIYLGGSHHEVTLLNSGIQPSPTSQTIQLGGMKTGLRYMEYVTNRNDYALSGSTIVNWTDQPVVLDSISSSCSVSSYGAIENYGSGNSVSSISPVTITASDAIDAMYNTVDADPKTYWSAEGAGQWIQYDLGRTRNLYAVSVQWRQGAARSYNFDIQTSANASSWTTVWSGSSSGSTENWEEYDFHTQNARYIRLVGDGNSYDDSVQILDVEVDLKDRFAMVKTKSDAGENYIAQNTLDGDLSTSWAAEGDGQWIQYDFLKTKTVKTVALAWQNGASRSYSFDIMVSDHPMGPWNTVYSGDSSGSTAELEEYAFAPVNARFLRITGHGNSDDDWNNISEIFVDTDLVEEDSGRVAHWSMDEGTGSIIKDVSGHGFDGSFSGGSWATAPDGSPALSFDGADATVSLPARAFDSISNEVTIALWAYGGSSQPAADCVLRAENDSGDPMLSINLPGSDGRVYWDAGNADGYDRISTVLSGSEISGAWNHWVFVKDAPAGSLDIYLNGELLVSAPKCIRAVGGITQATLGSGINELFYDGMLDDVRLYNTAMNPAQVAALYEQSSYYRDWVADAGLADSAAFAEKNPDGDSLSNLGEYAFGGDPLVDDSMTLAPDAVIPLDGSMVKYTFRRRIDATERGLSYVVEISDDITDPDSWSNAAITETEVTKLDAEFESVMLTMPVGTQGFIRLEIIKDNP